ncbi:MAG: hypothetical protein KDA27_22215 [Candidatus Eisenbacteria bacterium]|uniref:Uncharacterized protein n=1 Tax=Eiseniibacteriota bacterium TaxID=2212470 RepID=A0A956SHJ7_UNCEI|nr:hypothetical protein [Candidatus Eisenbacteria bacterium]
MYAAKRIGLLLVVLSILGLGSAHASTVVGTKELVFMAGYIVVGTLDELEDERHVKPTSSGSYFTHHRRGVIHVGRTLKGEPPDEILVDWCTHHTERSPDGPTVRTVTSLEDGERAIWLILLGWAPEGQPREASPISRPLTEVGEIEKELGFQNRIGSPSWGGLLERDELPPTVVAAADSLLGFYAANGVPTGVGVGWLERRWEWRSFSSAFAIQSGPQDVITEDVESWLLSHGWRLTGSEENDLESRRWWTRGDLRCETYESSAFRTERSETDHRDWSRILHSLPEGGLTVRICQVKDHE